MLTLISPAKTQDFTNHHFKNFSQPKFLKKGLNLVSSLQKLSKNEIASLMSVSDKIAELNYERFQNFQSEFTLKNAKQAILAFKGDVYGDIEVDDYSEADFEFAQCHLRIISGLYGLLRPLDLIMPYRLEMKTKLANEAGKDLYEFWGNDLAQEVAKFDQIVNLASNEYGRAIVTKENQQKMVTPVFKDFNKGQYRIIAIFAKKARGAMTNYIIRKKIDNVEKLKKFNVDGYEFCEQDSDERQFVFKRKK